MKAIFFVLLLMFNFIGYAHATLKLSISLKPSFHENCEFTVVSDGKENFKLTFNYGGVTQEYNFTQEQGVYLLYDMERLESMAETNRDHGFDGILARIVLEKDDIIIFNNEVWSPNGGTEYSLIQGLFALIEELPIAEESVHYLDSLSSYFNFSPPWRVILGDPLKVRFHSSLSISYAISLRRLFKSLPTDQDIEIDMSYLTRMGALLYSDFRTFSKTHVVSKWYSSELTEIHLKNIGIKESSVIVVGRSKKSRKKIHETR